MFKSYLKIAFRNLLKSKVFSFINVFSLSIGIACCILIFLFVRDEWSYDDFHKNAEQIYRLALKEDYGEKNQHFNTITPLPMGQAVADYFPEIEKYARIATRTDIVRYGDINFSERYHLVDKEFFELFSFQLLRGDLQNPLPTPNSVVLTEAMVRKYFGDDTPLGKRMSIKISDEMQEFTVTGIAANPPANSSIQFDFLLPFEKTRDIYSERAFTHWWVVVPETYVLFNEQADASEVQAKIPLLVKKIMGDRFKEGEYGILLQPLSEIHLGTGFPSGLEPTSDPAYSYILSGIAFLVLLIACINFMTLSIGRSTGRALEVGVRKVVGAMKTQLMKQFWGEALLLSFFAMLLGIGLAELFLPAFNSLANKSLDLNLDVVTLSGFVFMTLAIGFVAGSYPAAVLSNFRPIDVLKGHPPLGGNLRGVWKGSFFQKGLVVLQFALSIMLIICTLLMTKQMDFLQIKNLGFDREQIVVIPTNANSDESMNMVELYRNELLPHKDVVKVSASANTFGEGWFFIGFNTNAGSYENFWFNPVDFDFIELMGMKIVQGRDFSRQHATDRQQAVIINEAFVKEFGLKNPVGGQLPGKFPEHSIIGVVKDFNFRSLHESVEPLVLSINPGTIFRGASDVNSASDGIPKIAVKIRGEDISGTLATLRGTWLNLFPDIPFDYSFLDERVERQYRAEERWQKIVSHSSTFAIVIACLGLFGLASLAVTRRTKEIGVRKILGATAANVMFILSKEFTIIVLIAILVAWPAAYLVMNSWLQDFAYRIDIGFEMFIFAGLFAFGIALITVSYHSIKATFTNPVDALRYE